MHFNYCGLFPAEMPGQVPGKVAGTSCVYCGFLILFEGFMARVGACPASLREDARWLEQVEKKT